ncbi:hypothetical protein [Pseudodonghicola flavimaris]|uniref:Calcium-binding protein n=1 Tax=Pseudodonghicola flavimaris TaxID=3050036 RepID=A0ABT7F807_9RHOB|nr:hypothetical protein [Pseudodonghicola flavimaris]MDK3020752.1 hypothetical protein [Pseudodonghicola flavimaris]
MLTLTGRITAKDELLDTDLRHLGSLVTGSGSYLYAATGQNGGISVYRLDAGGGLARLTDSSYFDVSGLGLGRFDIVERGGAAELVLHGTGDGSLIGYAIEADGSLAEAASTDLPGHGGETPASVAAFGLGAGRSALYMVDAETGGIDAWISDSSGSIVRAASLGGTSSHYVLDSQALLQVVPEGPGGGAFLLAADGHSQGVSCYTIDAATGALSRSATLGAADGLGVAGPSGLQAVTAGGATWVVLAAAGSSSITVMQLGADGSLTATDHVIDTRATRFDAVTALEVVVAEERVFVLAGGADDGLSLFTLLSDGRLVHLQSLTQETGMGLENITSIEAVPLGDAIQIFVTSGSGSGVTQFALDLGRLGSVLDARASEGEASGGTETARDGRVLITGSDGDDVLVSGSAGAEITGGDGGDTFVLAPTEGTLRILDFERGSDRLDLSAFPMLRSPDQLRFEPIATGIWVRYGSTELKVLSADGKPLLAADLWPDGFDTPDRIPLPEAEEDAAGTEQHGSAAADRLSGGAGDDLLEGLGGADRLRGGGGADRLLGGAGNDRMRGGAGIDLLRGGAGRDRLWGQRGDDHLLGGDGNDLLKGGGGTDRMEGETGSDRLLGQAGRDRLSGGAGDDDLSGGAGRDVLLGGAGDDRLTGGARRDRFVFEADHGDDSITDFDPDQDQIRLDIPGLSYAALKIVAAGEDTLIDTGEGTIVLEGIDPGDLEADHFLFS